MKLQNEAKSIEVQTQNLIQMLNKTKSVVFSETETST